MRFKKSIFALLLLSQSQAFAGTTGMPWEGFFPKIIDSLNGPVAFGISVIITAVFGFFVAHSEGAGWMKWGIRILFGLSIATSGTSLASTFFGISRGLLF